MPLSLIISGMQLCASQNLPWLLQNPILDKSSAEFQNKAVCPNFTVLDYCYRTKSTSNSVSKN